MSAPFRILTVDNEPSVTTSLKYDFASPRFEVLSVDSGAVALDRLEAVGDPYDFIIVDQKMPNLTGVELIDEIKTAASPPLRRRPSRALTISPDGIFPAARDKDRLHKIEPTRSQGRTAQKLQS